MVDVQRSPSANLMRLLWPVRHRLLVWVVVAALVGLAVPGATSVLRGLVPVFLAGQVLGVALNLTPGEIQAALRRLPLVGLALLCQ